MKTFGNAKGVKFGFSAVNAGQRNVAYDPQLIATSTNGGFRITAPVSKALGIQHGDYIMFVSNVDLIDAAIAQQDPELVAYCEQAGLEFGTPEAAIAIHKEFDIWGVAKGIAERDGKGNYRTMSVRLTKDDRVRFVKANYDTMLESALANGDDDLKAALNREGATEEELINLLCPFVVADEVTKMKGSKGATPSGVTGIGVNINFTDTNVWNQLKHDLGDDMEAVNRIFTLSIEDMQDVEIYDGYENVTVKVLPLGEFVDKAPARLGSKEE